MKTCPDLETLVDFYLSPLEENKSAVAAHIFCCEACQLQLKLFYQNENTQTLNVPREDLSAVRSYIRDRIVPVRSSLWKKLEEKLATFVESVRIPHFPAITPAPVLNASRNRTGSGTNATGVKILFAADTAKTDPSYWQALLEIPPRATPSSMLKVLIVNYRGVPVIRGKLQLLGIDLDVCNGLAQIKLSDFQNNLHCPLVSYTDISGKTTSGDLIIC